MPIISNGFFKGDHHTERDDVPYSMLVPLMVLAVLSVLLGAFPSMLTELFTALAGTLM
jgi:formate hydrogenlyase subunit 3/multisubunit Na+/H+ antiporter MnhD subunit